MTELNQDQLKDLQGGFFKRSNLIVLISNVGFGNPTMKDDTKPGNLHPKF